MPELRGRMTTPEFWFNHTIGTLDDQDRLLFLFLVQYADDHGRFELDLPVMCGLFWFHREYRDQEEFSAAFSRVVSACRYIQHYEVNGRKYCVFSNWNDYQKPPHPKASRIPPPDTTASFSKLPQPSVDCGNLPQTVPQVKLNGLNQIGLDSKGVGSKPPAAPPSEAASRMAQASSQDALFAAVLDVCALDYNCSPPLWRDVERVVASSHAAGRDAASIRAQAEWFKQNHWRGKRGELPAPKDLLDTAVQFGRGVITGGGGNGLAAAKRRMLDRIKSGPDNS